MPKNKSKTEPRVDKVVHCEECGNKIPKARLKVVPTATFCVECQKDFETTHDTMNYFVPEDDPSELLDIITPDE